MSFKQQLQRLTEIAHTRQRGIREDERIVSRRDLAELIYYFNLVDKELREVIPQLKAEQAKSALLDRLLSGENEASSTFYNDLVLCRQACDELIELKKSYAAKSQEQQDHYKY